LEGGRLAKRGEPSSSINGQFGILFWLEKKEGEKGPGEKGKGPKEREGYSDVYAFHTQRREYISLNVGGKCSVHWKKKKKTVSNA